LKLTDVSEVCTASIIGAMNKLYHTFSHGLFVALIMEAVCTSETSVNLNANTWCYIPENSKLPTLPSLIALELVRSFIICTHSQIPLGRSNQGECGGQGMWHAWERRENCTRLWWKSPKETDHSEDQGVGGFDWVRIGTGGELL
jgi:hypothetical protein